MTPRSCSDRGSRRGVGSGMVCVGHTRCRRLRHSPRHSRHQEELKTKKGRVLQSDSKNINQKMSKTYARSSKKNSTATTAFKAQVQTCSAIQKQDHQGKRKQLPKICDVPEVRVKKTRQSPVQDSASVPIVPKKGEAKKNKKADKNVALLDVDKKVPPVSRRKSPRSLDAKVSSPIAKQQDRRSKNADSTTTASSKPSRPQTPAAPSSKPSRPQTPATPSSKPSRSQAPYNKTGPRNKRGASRS